MVTVIFCKVEKIRGRLRIPDVCVCVCVYSGYDDTHEMKKPRPREGNCTASGGSLFQSLTVLGKNVLFL